MQILFKFWLGHTKKMTYEHTLSEIHKVIPEFTDDIIPLQYTGLSDLNGKGIFNGDVLHHKYDDNLFNWLITFNDGAFVLRCIGIEGYLMDIFRITQADASNRVIIGNIYENPELLNPSVK